jgi:hypothetical protein
MPKGPSFIVQQNLHVMAYFACSLPYNCSTIVCRSCLDNHAQLCDCHPTSICTISSSLPQPSDTSIIPATQIPCARVRPWPTMMKSARRLNIELGSDEIRVKCELQISFHRTIRVPDNEPMSCLPPDLDAFPLERVSQYAEKLPADMVARAVFSFPCTVSTTLIFTFISRADMLVQNLKQCGSTSNARVGNST